MRPAKALCGILSYDIGCRTSPTSQGLCVAPLQPICEACGGVSTPRPPWLLVCHGCGFQQSSLTAGPGTGIDGIEQLRKLNFESLLDSIEQIAPVRGSRLLEIGAAKGWFLEAALLRGASAFGIEPETAAAQTAQEAGLNVEEGLFPTAPRDRGPYDIIVLNDVFEHIPNPALAAIHLDELLAPNGLLVLNLPSSEGALYRIAQNLLRLGISGPFERLWQYGMPSPHISYFSPTNLKLLIERSTSLRRIVNGRLMTVTRSGLKVRVQSQSAGLPWWASYAVIWALSFILPALPPDIQFAIFRKPPSS
jgi:SAM-dependent methyltransferase